VLNVPFLVRYVTVCGGHTDGHMLPDWRGKAEGTELFMTYRPKLRLLVL